MDPLLLSVITALITAVAMLISSFINAVVALKASRRASVTEFIKLRAKAFSDVMENDVRMHQDDFSSESVARLVASIHQASLFASEDTVLKLLIFSKSVKKGMNDKEVQFYRESRMAALHAMRFDLMNSATPRAGKSRWQRLWQCVRKKQSGKQ